MDEDFELEHRHAGRMDSGSANKKQVRTQGEIKNKNRMEELESFNQKIKTYITHNKGASWELLKAPEKDMSGKSTECFMEDGCSLHLQMYSNNDQTFAPPYS